MSQPRRPTTKRRVSKPKPLTPDEIVDQTLKREYERAMKALEAASEAETEQWDAKWEAVGVILDHDPPLYLAGGFRDLKGFARKHLQGAAPETIRTSVRVAKHFDPAAEKLHGTARLALLLDYLEAGDGKLPAVAIDPARTRVRVRRGRAFEPVRFPQLTFDELRAAVRHAKGGSKGARAADPAPLAAVRQQLSEGGFAGVTLRGTAARYDVLGIGYDDSAALHRALAKAKLPKTK